MSSVAVSEKGEVRGVFAARTDEDHSSRLFRQVEELLREFPFKASDFDAFAVSNGPGSFTGLRVGIAAAKAWGEVHSKPVFGISTLEALAIQSSMRSSMVVPVLDARRGQIYFGRYVRDAASPCEPLRLDGDEEVASPEAFFAWMATAGQQDATIISIDAALARSLGQAFSTQHPQQRELLIEEASPVLAPFVAKAAYARLSRGQPADPLLLDANYVRRSDAEAKWKEPAL